MFSVYGEFVYKAKIQAVFNCRKHGLDSIRPDADTRFRGQLVPGRRAGEAIVTWRVIGGDRLAV
jgi:hypothetical protein